MSQRRRLPIQGRPRATTPAEDRFLSSGQEGEGEADHSCRQLVVDPFQASGRRISATTVRNRFQLCVSQRTTAKEPLMLGKRTCFLDAATMGFCAVHRRVQIYNGEISLGGHTDLHVFHGGTVTGLRYRDEILDPYVRPYAAAIGNDFILMDDNARPHRAGIVEEYLEDHGLERMEWPARSPDLNPIEHLWDYLGREVAALNPPPRSLHELKQGLLCVWSSLPIPVSDNLINSMGNRCRQCIQVRGGHIPY
ncbi:transposable element Tcb2 transposase [Trichonephila clavipes]|nr:transposable element Tcb2 transposase [Trichonephila clavipes]